MIVFSLQIVNQLQSKNFQIFPHIPSLKNNHQDEKDKLTFISIWILVETSPIK